MIEQLQPTSYTIDAKAVNAIGNYLAARPYREVVGLIDGLRNAVPIYGAQQPVPAAQFTKTPEGYEHVAAGTQSE